MEQPSGEPNDRALGVDFDRRLRLELHGSRITADGGIVVHRELDDVLGLTDRAGAMLADGRRGKNTFKLNV